MMLRGLSCAPVHVVVSALVGCILPPALLLAVVAIVPLLVAGVRIAVMVVLLVIVLAVVVCVLLALVRMALAMVLLLLSWQRITALWLLVCHADLCRVGESATICA